MVVGGIEPKDDLSIFGRENDVALTGSGLGGKLSETTLVVEIIWASFRAIVGFDQLSCDCGFDRLDNVDWQESDVALIGSDLGQEAL